MSSPSNVAGASVGIRDGTRVILREITANLQNSPPGTSPKRKTSNEGSASKVETQQQLQQHDVKVRFIREFADAPSTTVREGIPETSSLSSASSFQSLASTLSSKCSSGICVDSSPNKSANNSYLSPEITGLDDLISACENIRLDDPAKDQSFELRVDSEDNSPDTTFTSATDRNSPNCTREISPINLEDQVHPNLNITSDIDKPVSPINQPSSTDQNLNITTEITSPALPIDNEADCNFNITRDIESDLSSIAKEPDSNLNVPGEIHRENSPGICRKEENVNLNVIVEIHGDNSQEIGENLDVDLAEEIEKESAFFCSQGNSLLNVTTDITDNPTIDHPNEPNLDLDSTRVISRENSPAKCPSDFNFELDTTREVTREFSSLNREALATEESEILNENSADSLTNSDTHTLEFVDALSTSPNLEKSNESFVQCVSDIAQLPESKESELLAKNFESDIGNSEILKSTSDDSKDGLKGYEDCPLELITPSLSEFHENLCSPNFELVDKTEISLVQNLPNFSVQEVKIPNESGDFVDKSEEIVKDTTTETIIPGLPSLSSIHLPPELNESTNLLVLESPPKQIDKSNENQDQSPHPSGTEKTGEIPIKDCSSLEKFVTAVSSENCSRNSLSAIQEPTFFSANNLLDTSLNVRDRGTGISAVLPPLDKPILPVTANCTVPEITSHSVTEDIATHLKKERTRGEEFNSSRNTDQDSNNRELASNEYHSEEEEGFIRLEAGIANAEIEKESFPEIGKKGNNSNEELDVTVTADDLTIDEIPESDQFAKFLPQRQSTTFEPKEKLEPQKSTLVAGGTGGHNFVCPSVPVNDNYEQFKPQKRSTSLDHFKSPVSSKPERQKTHYLTAFSIPEESSIIEKSGKSFPSKNISNVDNRCNFEQLEVAANSVANDIFNSSLNFPEENEHFVSAESEVFHDPSNFEFLLSKTPRKNTKRNLRDLSLYVKFDPLVSNTSMLPQGNIQNASPPANEARNGENNTAMPNVGSPKRNPAIAAIDRLLFYSPMSGNTTPTNTNTTIQKTNDTQEKLKPAEEASEETINMAKELELVRTTVLQLEEQLEKLKIDHEEALETQASYKEKINQLQAQLAQEVKHKNEITVVVDEYEISISRLVAERERDRKNLDLEKAKLQEELAAAKHHLDNTEAAFNDVHLKYERLKAVVATYKNNEAELKKSLQENVEIIKSLENRYEQVKSHATARLEKANSDLEEIRKQNDSESVRLRAMLRKAELKSNSLAELVEQKTKENKELTQILDELIARVGSNKAE